MEWSSSGIEHKKICKLVKKLSSSKESIVLYAVSTLHSLLLHQGSSKDTVRMAGGLKKMLTLLQRDNENILAFVLDCLHALAYRHEESKLFILAGNGATLLLRLMLTNTDEKLLFRVARLLQVLSVSSNKRVLVDAGGMQTLSVLLNHQNPKIVLKCLFTIRNLSDVASRLNNVDNLIRSLLRLLNRINLSVMLCVAGILSNMTCNNDHNKMIICQAGGIRELVHTLILFEDKEAITEPIIITLRHLTIRHPDAEIAQNEVRLYNGLKVIVKLLHPPSTYALIKVVIELIQNLALCAANHAPLREYGAIQRLAQLLIKADLDTQRSNVSFHESPMGVYEHNVTTEEIVQGTVGALHILARDGFNRAIIQGFVIIPVLIKLLYNENEDIQRVAVGLLCELASDEEGVEILEDEEAVILLLDLICSRNEHVSTYAMSVLYKLLV